MKNHNLFLIKCFLSYLTIAFPNLAVTAELYKWTDEKGQVHYTKEPPPSWTPAIGSHKKARTVETLDTEELKKRNVIPPLGSNRVTSKENESQEQHQEERKSPSSLDDATATGMNYELARRNAQILQSNAPVFVRDKQGNKVILDAQQREAALAKVQKDIARSCEPVPSSKEVTASNMVPPIPNDSKQTATKAAQEENKEKANPEESVKKVQTEKDMANSSKELAASNTVPAIPPNNSEQVDMKAAQEEKKKADAEESVRKVQAAKDRAKKESMDNIAKAAQIGPKIAKDIGVEWQFSETKDPMTDARILKSEASFEGEGQQVIDIEATCLVESKKLSVTATAFGSPNLDKGVPFIQENKEVNLLVRLNNKNPINIKSNLTNYNNHLKQLSSLAGAECFNIIRKSPKAFLFLAASLGPELVFSQDPEKRANDILDGIIEEYPDVSCLIIIEKNNEWLELSELRVQFPLAHGNVVARIAPYEPNLRKVLEGCAEITP